MNEDKSYDPKTADARKQGNIDANRFDIKSLVTSSATDFSHRLWSVEAQLVRLTFEVAMLYSAEGAELARVRGNATSVALSDKHKQLVHGGILTHNHPDGAFFSVGDVQLAHELDLTELRAISKREPVQIFSMRRPEKGWDLQAYQKLMSQEEAHLLHLYNRIPPFWLSSEELKTFDANILEQIRLAQIERFPGLLKQLGLTYTTLPLQEPAPSQ